MRLISAVCAVVALALSVTQPSAADDPAAQPPVLQVPAGFSIQLVAGSPLVERPIVAAFDDEGHLYVAESSGSNDPVAKQLELRPHRIVRLEDTDSDGTFDRRTVFADRMMFPEGVAYLDGSVYVSAPPSIWKLTDADGDGVAETRVEWFQGKTLTGCANDLHGPYVGPDGWLYWCKGAFAEQTHTVHGKPWTTRAAHIFRCQPDGTGLEPVMTGGMDNPVDVVFTPDGERVLSATYLVGEGRRDGLVHAIYGGVYGKNHGVLAGHPRTGELMPAVVLMSPAAPCGLERYDSPAFGHAYRDNLFVCQFNLRKVSRHVLRVSGSTFVSDDSDFVTSDNVDFHPTDVLMDADGSMLIIDTGGWYKLCCPTSQLWKPDILGGIYRVRRDGAAPPADPRGRQIAWSTLSAERLWDLVCDARPAVRQRASREFARRGDSNQVRKFLADLEKRGISEVISEMPAARDAELCAALTAGLARAWMLSQVENDAAKSSLRQLLQHPDEAVRHVALHAVSLHRDAKAYSPVVKLVASDTAANRRLAAEALGRIGEPGAVPHLLRSAGQDNDRVLQHSLTYALIEIADPAATKAGLLSDAPGTVATAIVSLDQMPGGGIKPEQVIPLLNSHDSGLRDTARWLLTQHPEWGGELSEWFRTQVAQLPDASPAAENALESLMVTFASDPSIQRLLADTLTSAKSQAPARQLALRVMGRAKLRKPAPEWRAALARVIGNLDEGVIPLAIATARQLPPSVSKEDPLNGSLVGVADSPRYSLEVRIGALAVAARSLNRVSEPQFELLIGGLTEDNPVTIRSAAADAISSASISWPQLERLCEAIESAGPLELNRLVSPFARSTDEQLGVKLLVALESASALASLRIDHLRETLKKYGPAVQHGIDELESLVNVDATSQRARIEELLPRMAEGDVRRGHAVFHSSKAACSACHRLGHAGGTVGPELTRIGESRTERDILESILYPNLSFVRSYEPVLVVTVDGRTINGTIRDESESEYILAIGADQEVRVPRGEVEQIEPSAVSIMPGGLDRQLSVEELADLVAFLKGATGR
jgi:putative membrane-bound dehydrogenase-like protein